MSKTIAIFIVVVFTLFLLSVGANAQTLGNSNALGQQATGTAVNSGVNVNSYSSPFNYGSADQRYSTNQSASTPPAFSTPAVMGTCATAGFGIGAQAVGGGLSFAGKGGVDVGCDLQRDLTILREIGAPTTVLQQRACQKPEIRQAIEASGGSCKTAAEVQGVLDAAPVAARKQAPPYTAGG